MTKNSIPTILITGATGFVGSHLVDLLLEKGYHLIALARKTSDTTHLKSKGVEIELVGLNDESALIPILSKADYVYHVAGCVRAKKYETYHYINATLTENLLSAAVKSRKKFNRIVIVGSLACVGPSLLDMPKTELDHCKPVSNYGKSKLAQEQVVEKYKDKLDLTIIRPASVYGPREKDIFLFFKTISKGFFSKVGFGKRQLSFVFVKDLVEGMYQATLTDKTIGQTYFLNHNELVTWETLRKTTEKILDKKTIKITIPNFMVYIIAFFSEIFTFFSKKTPVVNFDKVNEILPVAWTSSSDKAMKDFNFSPKYGIEKGVEETIAWYKKENWL